ncbi:MAG: Sapep family Mn(2+)-dependent dipeptidase [Clostridia bacterium]|nr:Sapep family Mn(2+)-dependent dipeptidase [Clostridia bacterium]
MNNISINEAAKKYFADEAIKAQAISDLAEIIAVPSVAGDAEGIYPYGKNCALALDKAKELCEKYGFTTVNHDYHCMSVLFGDSEREIGIVCHLDVVPAGDGWSVEPYALTRQNGLLLGRGTHDDKGPFIQALYTLRFFKENGIKLPFTIRLILGSDEEVGSSDLEYFVKVCKPPMFSFTPDSEFPVCIGEKTIVSLAVEYDNVPDCIVELNGGTVPNAVAGYAYAVVKTDKKLASTKSISVSSVENGIKIEAVGKAAHAAMPESGVNAIALLCGYLLENGVVESKGAFDLIAASTAEYLGKTLGINASNEDFGYLTCVGGVISLANGKLIQSYNIRSLPETPVEQIKASVENAVSAFGGKVVAFGDSQGYFVSADDEKIKALTEACESVLGIECKPYTMGGGTYARWLPNTVAFGSGIESERGYLGSERGNAHQRDEYISEKELFTGMEIYSRAIGNLSKIV